MIIKLRFSVVLLSDNVFDYGCMKCVFNILIFLLKYWYNLFESNRNTEIILKLLLAYFHILYNLNIKKYAKDIG